MPAPPAAPDLTTWLRTQDWPKLRDHFERVQPLSAAEFEARGLTTMALVQGVDGVRHALGDLRQSCRLDRSNVLAAANLMQALIDVGELDEALQLTQDAMRQAPQVVPLAEKHAWALVAAGRWDEAVQAVAHALSAAAAAGVEASPKLVALAGELEPRWWKPAAVGGIELRLPRDADRAFVAASFGARDFISRYRRFQADDEAAVTAFLQLARRRPRQSGRIDWIVWRGDEPLGLACLADLEFKHGRGELLVGLLPAAAAGAAGLKASLAVMDFAFAVLGLRKLVSYVYGDNAEAQANTLHLGLRQEGVLRQQLMTPDGPLDLYVNGLLADEYRADERLQRMLARWRAG